MLPYAAQGCDNTVKTKIDVLFCFVLFCFDCLFVCLFVFGSYLLQFPFQIEKRKDFKRDAQKPVHVFHCFICNQNLQSVLFNFVPYTT